MKYLVTGGAGFIGSNFVHHLFKHHPDAQVVVLDKLTYAGNLDNLQDLENNPNFKFAKGDICDAEFVGRLVSDCDCVVHFAAESHVDRSVTNALEFVRTNVLGTATLLEAARKFGGKRFHHVSTDEVYGAIPLDSDRVWTEESLYNPHSPYSASKAASDHLVRAYHATYNLPVTISNCANNVGPYMYPEKLFPLAITNLIEGKKVPVYGTGLQVREWLYVDDHCSAIDAIIDKGRIGETYFVGPDGERINNLEVVRRIVRTLGKSEAMIEFVQDRPGHDAKYALSTEKIKQELLWSPKNSLDETIAKTVNWYVSHQDWWRKIRTSPEYQSYYNKQYAKA